MNPALQIDGYKVDHRRQYPDGTQIIFSNMTARKTRRPEQPDMVFFGLQYFIKEFLIRRWNEDFFKQPQEAIISQFTRRINSYLVTIYPVSAFVGFLAFFAKEGYRKGLEEAQDLDKEMMA